MHGSMDVESPWGIHKKLRSCKTMIPAYIAIYLPFTINFPINSLSVNLTK